MLISPAEFVIKKFGGLTKTANACGLPVTTVQGWKDRGRIPQDHWLPLINAARVEDQHIELADFLKAHTADAEAAQ